MHPSRVIACIDCTLVPSHQTRAFLSVYLSMVLAGAVEDALAPASTRLVPVEHILEGTTTIEVTDPRGTFCRLLSSCSIYNAIHEEARILRVVTYSPSDNVRAV